MKPQLKVDLAERDENQVKRYQTWIWEQENSARKEDMKDEDALKDRKFSKGALA